MCRCVLYSLSSSVQPHQSIFLLLWFHGCPIPHRGWESHAKVKTNGVDIPVWKSESEHRVEVFTSKISSHPIEWKPKLCCRSEINPHLVHLVLLVPLAGNLVTMQPPLGLLGPEKFIRKGVNIIFGNYSTWDPWPKVPS